MKPVNPFCYIASCFQKYFQFRGRASRAEYWFFSIFASMLLGVGEIIDRFLQVTFKDVSIFSFYKEDGGFFSFAILVMISFPLLTVACRRLHDCNYSGWWQLMLIPLSILTKCDLSTSYLNHLVGAGEFVKTDFSDLSFSLMTLVFALFFFAQKGDAEANYFGAVPADMQRTTPEFSQESEIPFENFEIIEKLADLRDKGILTDEEFQTRKEKYLML
ncbi:DUF805 domain-containing protein [Acetobacteraceae bacterium]|nr:DUF805 domain-containing protein [Acetobacteraceae bacterium]